MPIRGEKLPSWISNLDKIRLPFQRGRFISWRGPGRFVLRKGFSLPLRASSMARTWESVKCKRYATISFTRARPPGTDHRLAVALRSGHGLLAEHMNPRLCGALSELAMLRIWQNDKRRIDALFFHSDFKVVVVVCWHTVFFGKDTAFGTVPRDKRRQFRTAAHARTPEESRPETSGPIR